MTTPARDATFFFFSGTGNSYRVARWMAEQVRATGAQVRVEPIATAETETAAGGEGSLLGLVSPTHGFTAVWPMLRFAAGLPRGRGTQAMVVATRAGLKVGRTYTPGLEGTALYLLAFILILKGYRMRGVSAIDMPSNWLVLHPSLSATAVSGIKRRAQAKTERFMGRVLRGESAFGGRLGLLIGLALLPVSVGYLLIGRFFLAKLFFPSPDCNSCGQCARHCPEGAILMVGPGRQRPYWTFDCESCMRCMAYCPTRAVEASYGLAALLVWIGSTIPTLVILGWLVAHLPGLAFLERVPVGLIETPYVPLAAAAVYPLFHLLLRVPGFNRLMTATTPTHYYRRYHEPETGLNELDHPESAP